MTLRTQVERGEVNGRQITVIDTPGQAHSAAVLCLSGKLPSPCFATALKSLHSLLCHCQFVLQFRFSRLIQGLSGHCRGHTKFRAYTQTLALPTHSRHERRQSCLQRLLLHNGFAWESTSSRGAAQPRRFVIRQGSACNHHKAAPAAYRPLFPIARNTVHLSPPACLMGTASSKRGWSTELEVAVATT